MLHVNTWPLTVIIVTCPLLPSVAATNLYLTNVNNVHNARIITGKCPLDSDILIYPNPLCVATLLSLILLSVSYIHNIRVPVKVDTLSKANNLATFLFSWLYKMYTIQVNLSKITKSNLIPRFVIVSLCLLTPVSLPSIGSIRGVGCHCDMCEPGDMREWGNNLPSEWDNQITRDTFLALFYLQTLLITLVALSLAVTVMANRNKTFVTF